MPSSRATARSESLAAPSAASCLRASSLMAAVTSIRPGPGLLVRLMDQCAMAAVHQCATHSRAADHITRALLLLWSTDLGAHCSQARAVLTKTCALATSHVRRSPHVVTPTYVRSPAVHRQRRSTAPSAGWPAAASASWAPRMLSVRGRKSGEWRTHPGQPAPLRRRARTWSRRAATSSGCATCAPRAAGELRSAARCEEFTAVELADDEKPALLRAYLERWGWEVGRLLRRRQRRLHRRGAARRSAPKHPVFRITVDRAERPCRVHGRTARAGSAGGRPLRHARLPRGRRSVRSSALSARRAIGWVRTSSPSESTRA